MDTKDLAFFTRDELMEPETSLEVLALGEQIVRGLATTDAYRLFKALRRILTNWEDQKPGIPSALELQYARLRNLTRVIAIPLLNDEEVIETVKSSLVESLQHPEFDLDAYKTIFKRKLLTFPVTARDTYKEELRRALHENKERLTKQYLVVDGKDQLGTVGHWLSDYIKAVGGGEVDTLRRAEYFATRRADEADRAALKKLIDLYEFLKLSSLTAQGVEETLGAYYPNLGKYFILNEEGFAEEIPELATVFSKTTEVEVQKAPPAAPPKVAKAVGGEARTTGETKPPFNLPRWPSGEKLASAPLVVLSPPAIVSHEQHPLRLELEELIDQVLKNVELKMQNVEWLKDPILKKRVRSIVSARLRDIRDATETREMLVRGQKVGGMGLSGESGIRNQESGVMDIIEKAFREFQDKWKEVENKRRTERKKEQQGESHKQEQLKAEQEQKDLEERYQRLTCVISKPQVPPIPKQSSVRDFAISKAIPKPKIQITKSQEIATGRPKVALAMTKPSIALPTPPPPNSTSYVLRPTSSKVTDIRQPSKLLGPLEELQMLTLDDFRKLSGTVSESVNKILNKIEFIGQESLGRRLAAIAAWKKSPLYGLYTKLMGDSLSQKVSPEDLTRGGSTLTRDEFYAIMELNQKLRF